MGRDFDDPGFPVWLCLSIRSLQRAFPLGHSEQHVTINPGKNIFFVIVRPAPLRDGWMELYWDVNRSRARSHPLSVEDITAATFPPTPTPSQLLRAAFFPTWPLVQSREYRLRRAHITLIPVTRPPLAHLSGNGIPRHSPSSHLSKMPSATLVSSNASCLLSLSKTSIHSLHPVRDLDT